MWGWPAPPSRSRRCLTRPSCWGGGWLRLARSWSAAAGPGVMEAVCRGAQSAGGTTVGLLPGLDRAEGNPYLTISVPTGLGQGRNLLLVRSSDAVIAVGGGFGTLSEIALALRTGTPVIGLATWSLHLGSHQVDAFPVADTPDAAAQLALDAARSHEPGLRRPPRGG